MGDHDKKIKFKDAIRGELELADNDVDIVIMKSDGLPTYHFAHVVDDHFMRTTVVTRGEEWIPSTPIHIQLFRDLGWKGPKYAHLPVIMKLDHGNKRKLSKRKDPEAAVSYFLKAGYPPKGLLVYLMSIANSNFEEWTIANKSLDVSKFTFAFKKMSLDGALFDEGKLNYFCKEVLAATPKEELLKAVKEWAEKNSPTLLKKMDDDMEYFFMSEVADKMLYGAGESEWWNSVKEVAAANGFAIANKDYKANPDAYKGNISDAAEIIRIAITGQKDSPNLHEVIEILGKERVMKRLKNAI